MWENLNIALKSLNGIILLIIYLRSTTGLTDTIINELSGSFIESGIPMLVYLIKEFEKERKQRWK